MQIFIYVILSRRDIPINPADQLQTLSLSLALHPLSANLFKNSKLFFAKALPFPLIGSQNVTQPEGVRSRNKAQFPVWPDSLRRRAGQANSLTTPARPPWASASERMAQA